jgi:hypothetical protein
VALRPRTLDDQDDRRIIVRGPAAVFESLGPPRLRKETQLVVLDAPFVDADCFRRREPCVVPARTLLSQLP